MIPTLIKEALQGLGIIAIVVLAALGLGVVVDRFAEIVRQQILEGELARTGAGYLQCPAYELDRLADGSIRITIPGEEP